MSQELQPDNKDSIGLSWVSEKEWKALKLVLEFGFEEAINDTNFPGLGVLSPESINELKAKALQSRIDRLSLLIEGRKSTSYSIHETGGFAVTGSQDPVVSFLNDRRMKLLKRQEDLLTAGVKLNDRL